MNESLFYWDTKILSKKIKLELAESTAAGNSEPAEVAKLREAVRQWEDVNAEIKMKDITNFLMEAQKIPALIVHSSTRCELAEITSQKVFPHNPVFS